MTALTPEGITAEIVRYDVKEFNNRLLPVLRQEGLPRIRPDLDMWATELLNQLKQALSFLLPLRPHENEFIRRIREWGEINPELITANSELQETIRYHPAVLWSARRTTPA